MNLIDQIESEQLRTDIPEFSAGDTVVVQVKVREGNRQRLQAFEGVVIAKKNRGLNSAFTVRKISHGEGVERVFQTHSSMIDSVTVKRSGKVRKAKLYYLRGLTGKAARIKEKLNKKYLSKINMIKEKLKDKKTSDEEAMELRTKLQKIPLNALAVRKRNRCALTGRPRGVYR